MKHVTQNRYVLSVPDLVIFKVNINSVDNLWGEVEMILKVVQTAAILEIVHAAIGLVKSSWYITFLQGTHWYPFFFPP